MWKALKSAFSSWYDGEYIPYEYDSDSSIIFVGGWCKRHWSANALRALVTFHQQHWKWAIGTYIAIAGLLQSAYS